MLNTDPTTKNVILVMTDGRTKVVASTQICRNYMAQERRTTRNAPGCDQYGNEYCLCAHKAEERATLSRPPAHHLYAVRRANVGACGTEVLPRTPRRRRGGQHGGDDIRQVALADIVAAHHERRRRRGGGTPRYIGHARRRGGARGPPH